MTHKIAIIGGGIAGLTTAIAFKKAGYTPVVFEAAETMKPVGAGLGLAANAIKALDKLGIKDKVVEKGRILSSFTIKDEKDKIITYTDSIKISREYGIDNFTIHRAALHEALLSEIPGTQLYTGKKCVDINVQKNNIRLLFKDGSSFDTDYLIVADGIHSPVRQKLVPGSVPRFAGYTCWRAVIDNHTLNIDNSYEIWGSKGRFGAVPLADNKLYWFATVNSTANNARFKNFTLHNLKEWFKEYPAEIGAILTQTSESALIWNDIIDLKPIPKYAFDNILLLGDAAHATTPNMGQGACQAIEDAAVLYDELLKGGELNNSFLRFEKRRLPRTHFITNQSARIGKVAQAANPLMIKLRNALFRSIPGSIKDKQFKKLYNTDF
ncbi:FAD-dependent monooxygenase [Sphingobacterium thalpophilum]|uniref:3-hydroxybenzoate 6-hydroxylase n=1 Tax=Sphingobacterium thalpophilum TaxID=259 RepID=A0A4U9VE02_9SPHI|nr:FAD-dependent monooxygenase [Sphingobacterium thalpophilum]VTR43372.1 3-hydroxybenzoate 6-hydroxylase [Sphingobacterium thalpophilum]